MTETERQQVVEELRDKGFKHAVYTQYYGEFTLREVGGRKLYIKEAHPTIGFYGIAPQTMRPWAERHIHEFVNKIPDWKWATREQRNRDGDQAVWFNLQPTTDQEWNWYENTESRKNVIEAAWKLYQKLEKEGIFAPDFDPNNYTVNNAGDQTKDPMKNKSIVESTVKSLLEANLNVILTGAPGTGKTYTARQVAVQLVTEQLTTAGLPEDEQAEASDDEKTEKLKQRIEDAINNRIECVQFHPGYDYSDFVIGMKPVLLDANNKEVQAGDKVEGKVQVSYKWQDGIFKEFADKAREAYGEAVSQNQTPPKFVFLIDEINRADLSRVFGELFSLLEEGYRYPNIRETRIKLTNGEEFAIPNEKETSIKLPNGQDFVIPKNLYIIGTMNDIDRSVESMDFALRRRFAWYEVTAQQSDDIIRKKILDPTAANALVNAMQKLNDVIGGKTKLKLENEPETDLRLGTAYQLGGAIFAKFEKCDGNFDALWDNHISNVLGEYLRGHRYRDDILIALRGIFDDAIKEGNGEKSSEKTSEAPTAPTGQQLASQA